MSDEANALSIYARLRDQQIESPAHFYGFVDNALPIGFGVSGRNLPGELALDQK